MTRAIGKVLRRIWEEETVPREWNIGIQYTKKEIKQTAQTTGE